MKRISLLPMLVLVGCILLGASGAFAQTPMDNSDPDIDGKVWIHSSDSDKRAFLLGVSNAWRSPLPIRQGMDRSLQGFSLDGNGEQG